MDEYVNPEAGLPQEVQFPTPGRNIYGRGYIRIAVKGSGHAQFPGNIWICVGILKRRQAKEPSAY